MFNAALTRDKDNVGEFQRWTMEQYERTPTLEAPAQTLPSWVMCLMHFAHSYSHLSKVSFPKALLHEASLQDGSPVYPLLNPNSKCPASPSQSQFSPKPDSGQQQQGPALVVAAAQFYKLISKVILSYK